MRLRAAPRIVVLGIAVAFAGAFQAGVQDKPPVESVPQLGHPDTVNSVAFSPDSKTALPGGSDETLRL
jgi:WD40 repeat protein